MALGALLGALATYLNLFSEVSVSDLMWLWEVGGGAIGGAVIFGLGATIRNAAVGRPQQP